MRCDFNVVEVGPPFNTVATGGVVSVSLDGSRMAYVRGLDHVVSGLDGSNETIEGAGGRLLAISPDGQKLAYARRFTNGSDEGVFVRDIESDVVTEVVSGRVATDLLEWSPDSQRLLYLEINGNVLDLMVTNADGTGTPEVLFTFSQGGTRQFFDWSTDGSRVAAMDGNSSQNLNRIWTIPASGGTPTLAYEESGEGGNNLRNIEWSPDDAFFALYRSRAEFPDRRHSVEVVSSSGGTPTVLYSALTGDSDAFVVGATSEWIGGVPSDDIVVNDDRDLADFDAEDDRCDAIFDSFERGDQCTLRAALELANKRGGGTITFNIDGTPVIQIGELGRLPTIDVSVTLDGTTQAGGFVAIQPPGDISEGPGLNLGPGATGSRLRGLAVSGFRAANVRLEEGADGCTIEGNRIGTDLTGTIARGGGGGSCKLLDVGLPGQITCIDGDYGAGLHVMSSDNRIVDNVIAGNGDFTAFPSPETTSGAVQVLLDRNARGNVLQRNRIGYGADDALLFPRLFGDGSYEEWVGCTGVTCWASMGINVFGHDNVIGGAPGAANRIGGNMWDVWVRGEVTRLPVTGESMPASSGNTVSHNLIGTEAPVLVSPNGGFDGGLAIEGENNRAISNTITTTRDALAIGDGNRAIDNTITGWMEPVEPGDPLLQWDRVSSRGAVAVAGEGTTVRNNRITSGAWGIALDATGRDVDVSENVVEGRSGGLLVQVFAGDQRYQGSTIENNSFRATASDGYGLLFAGGEEIRVVGNTIEAPVGIAVPRNTFLVGYLQRVLVSQNSIAASLGIDLDSEGVTPNDFTDLDEGPNGLLNYPLIQQAVGSGSTLLLNGLIRGAFGASYTVEVFGNTACGFDRGTALRHGPGETYLGTATVETSAADVGERAFSLTASGLTPEQRYVTLTASRLDLDVTSEFSRCVLLADPANTSSSEVAANQTGEVLMAVDARVSIVGPNAASQGTAASKQAHPGGTIYATRYDAPPDTSAFTSASATAPSGALVTPTAVAPRHWLLAEDRLTVVPNGETPARFEVCLVATDSVRPGRTAEVVLVRRSESTEGRWVPLDTDLVETVPDLLCTTVPVEALGEFGLGGAADAFPVMIEGDETAGEPPAAFALSTYPNPAAGLATVEVALTRATEVRAEVFDLLGRRVAVLHDGVLAVGTHPLRLDAARLPSGLYVVRAATPNVTLAQRIAVVQ